MRADELRERSARCFVMFHERLGVCVGLHSKLSAVNRLVVGLVREQRKVGDVLARSEAARSGVHRAPWASEDVSPEGWPITGACRQAPWHWAGWERPGRLRCRVVTGPISVPCGRWRSESGRTSVRPLHPAPPGLCGAVFAVAVLCVDGAVRVRFFFLSVAPFTQGSGLWLLLYIVRSFSSLRNTGF